MPNESTDPVAPDDALANATDEEQAALIEPTGNDLDEADLELVQPDQTPRAIPAGLEGV